jgi:hypothetical protein
MTTWPAAKTIAESSPSRKSGGANAVSGAPVRRSKAWISLGPTGPSSSAPCATYTAVGDAARPAMNRRAGSTGSNASALPVRTSIAARPWRRAPPTAVTPLRNRVLPARRYGRLGPLRVVSGARALRFHSRRPAPGVPAGHERAEAATCPGADRASARPDPGVPATAIAVTAAAATRAARAPELVASLMPRRLSHTIERLAALLTAER